jgi:hypothetical protein
LNELFFNEEVVMKTHYQYDSDLVFSAENLSVENIAILSDDLLETPSSHSANPLLFYHSIALHLLLVVALAATIELGLHLGVMIRAPDFFFFGLQYASAA